MAPSALRMQAGEHPGPRAQSLPHVTLQLQEAGAVVRQEPPRSAGFMESVLEGRLCHRLCPPLKEERDVALSLDWLWCPHCSPWEDCVWPIGSRCGKATSFVVELRLEPGVSPSGSW